MAAAERIYLAGVMGWPVAQSRSPALHNHWFERNGMAGRYVPLAVAPENLEQALRALPALGFVGCNLTIPLKERALEIVDEADPVARQIGAISCVTVTPDGALIGTNNDHFGFIENLREAFPDWSADEGPATVVGAGGAARAVVYALARAGVREIRVANRTHARAVTLASALGGPVTPVAWADRHAALADAALLVNTTDRGMVGNAPLDLALDRLPAKARVADVIYTPGETPFLAAARRRDHRTTNGLGMLLHQARPAWQRWFGLDPKVTPELRLLLEATL